ncbi:MAG: phage integrase SAM-like domain-containing protein [Flavisolibacter sp.]
MGEISYYLKKKEESTGKSLIYLQWKYNGLKLTYSFGQTINPKEWNRARQRVKNNKQRVLIDNDEGEHSLNDLLDNLAKVLKDAYTIEIKKGIPIPSTLKKHLDEFLDQNKNGKERKKDKPTFFSLAEKFISGEIKNKEGDEKSYHTTKAYNTVVNHLKAFEKKERYPVDFDTINLEFYRKYINYLSKVVIDKKDKGKAQKIGLAQNTRAKHIQVIKAIMNEAFDLKYTTNTEHRHKKFASVWKEVDAVYLTKKELIKLFRHDFSKNKRLEAVRDLFVFQSYVGLRYSDASTVKPENIVQIENEEGQKEDFLKMITIKTGDEVVIPCDPIVLEIFNKYKHNPNRLPRPLSNQKYNDYIKEVCKDAGFTEKGRLTSEAKKELWECISSHTARRNFATNLYLEGFPVIDLMKITTHKTEAAFMKYIRHSKLDAARRLQDHMRKQWASKLLKIA